MSFNARFNLFSRYFVGLRGASKVTLLSEINKLQESIDNGAQRHTHIASNGESLFFDISICFYVYDCFHNRSIYNGYIPVNLRAFTKSSGNGASDFTLLPCHIIELDGTGMQSRALKT